MTDRLTDRQTFAILKLLMIIILSGRGVEGDKLAATKIDLGKQLGNNCNVY